VAFGPELPRILSGGASTLAINDLQAFGIRGGAGGSKDRLSRAFEALYQDQATDLLATSAAEGFEAARILRAVDPAKYTPANGAEYPRGKFGRTMQQIAQLIRADVGLEIAFADIGGWDTHVNQGAGEGQLATRLAEFGGSLAAFSTDLGERMSDVVLLTMSEFGRTVKENGSSGTDHGHATAMLVMGGPVRGGRILGQWPGLDVGARFEGRDVAVTTDFRDLFAELLARHMGAGSLTGVFPGFEVNPSRFPGAIR
jgi:uncharacterized protein (DUF1501 family)